MAKNKLSSKESSDISIVVTALNEGTTIDQLMSALLEQSLNPAEIIVVDGGSSDDTVARVQAWAEIDTPIDIRVVEYQSTIGGGRNYGVEQARGHWIAFTDAGCVPERDWLQQLQVCQKLSGAEVVAGYYKGLPRTDFEAAVVPFVLVMPDRVNAATFLPASRSMLVKRKTFLDAGGFDESLLVSEDFALARKLVTQHPPVKMVFTAQAIVGWYPRSNVYDFMEMIFNQAKWDIIAGNWRPKVLTIYLRYILFVFLFVMWFPGFLLALTAYLGWAWHKNAGYVQALKAHLWLPLLQILADFAVMEGVVRGFLARRAS